MERERGCRPVPQGLYTFFQRAVPYPQLVNFDAPDSNLTCTRRFGQPPAASAESLNDPAFFEAAQALAARVLNDGWPD
jgi:hypothetical protein